MSVKYLYLVAVAAIIGCGPGSSASPRTPAVRRMSNILSANEIVAAQADLGTAYDALARLRPNWLAAHGTSSFSTPGTEFAIVFVDGHRYGELESLRNIPATQVADFRYYDVTEAGGTFGLYAGTGGVIAIRTR